MKRRSFIKGAFGLSGLVALNLPAKIYKEKQRETQYNLYWGDMHCHCGISYGSGSLEDAFRAAHEQRLDFCSVVGHSSWHDTPRDEEHMNRLRSYIAYHDEGYERLKRFWPKVKQLTKKMMQPGKFIPFLAFEWHSIRYGDHNVYYLEPEHEIVYADSIEELRDKMRELQAIVIPHHIGYLPDSRGINWDHFKESSQSPFVEVFSYHGCSVSDTSPYPMLREMGPRSSEKTMETGLRRGYKFGIYASTDNHYGYPGSYGEGKIAVYAKQLTKDSLWEAFKARRIYAVTGDRIMIDFAVNDTMMGQESYGQGKQEIDFSVQGEDYLDYVDLVKNCRVVKRFVPPFTLSSPKGSIRAKIRFEWGWGVKTRFTEWAGTLKLTDGSLHSVTPCFRAQPTEGIELEELTKGKSLISRITAQDEKSVSFKSYSLGNPTPRTPINNSLVLNVEMPVQASIMVSVNGRKFEHKLEELLQGQRSHLVSGYLDVAVSFHRAVPEQAFQLNGHFVDSNPENPTDNYYLCVRQKNNQWGWSSPVWVSR